MLIKLREYTKAVLAAVGGLTPGLAVGVLALVGVHIDTDTATLIIATVSPILAALGVAAGPANKPKTPKEITETPNALLTTWLD